VVAPLYYEAWRETTCDQLDVRLLELMPPLRRLVPPASVIDKTRAIRPFSALPCFNIFMPARRTH
jgi:hypothetical protein